MYIVVLTLNKVMYSYGPFLSQPQAKKWSEKNLAGRDYNVTALFVPPIDYADNDNG